MTEEAVLVEGTIWKFTTLANGCSRLTLEMDIPNTQIYRRKFPEAARIAIAPLLESGDEFTP